MNSGPQLIVSGAGGWLRAALINGEDLIEAAVDMPGGPAPDTPGTVIWGRVKTVSKPLGAAFINIGGPHDGFLPLAEMQRPPHEGQALCVRVTAPGGGGKGPKLSAKAAPPEGADTASAKPPAVLALAPPAHVRLIQGLAAADTPGEIICDTAEALHAVPAHNSAPAKLWNRPEPLFKASGAAAAIDAALAEEIPLPGGGRITIERTKLGVVIDVDAGSGGAALAVNLEAAAAAARALRARNLSGLIVADFMRMKAPQDRQKVLAALAAASAHDPAGLHIGGFTGLGLAEMTRARRSPALEDALRGFAG